MSREPRRPDPCSHTQHGALPVAILTCVLLGASAHAGQLAGDTTGAIRGAVADRTGAALPAVAIVVSSGALMQTRTAVTDAEGTYRFVTLPPGEYTLVFTRKGFATLTREAVHVSLGATTLVDIDLAVAAISEGVLVERGAPVIDTQSTAIAARFDARQLASLPGSRSVFAILAATPSVHVARFEVGGNSGDAGSPYSAYGTFGSNRPMIEGLHVAGIFPTGFKLDYGSFEEVSVGTGAHSAEWPAPGVQMQIVTKSGGNQYRGTLYADYENQKWQSFNVDENQIRRGAAGGSGLSPGDANRLWRYHDINADAGGYIRRDATWWYGSFREQEVSQRYINLPVEPHRTRATNYTAKTTHQIGTGHRLVAFAQAGRTEQPTRLDPFGPIGGGLTAATALNESAEATMYQRGWGWVAKGDWNAAVSDRALFEVRAGEFGVDRTQDPNGTAPRFEDVGTLVVRGANRHWRETLHRPQVLGSFTWVNGRWLGSHDLKVGGQILRTTVTEAWKEAYAGNVLHVLRNGSPIEVYVFGAPSRSTSGLWTYNAYGSDAWRVNDRLTLNLGLRFDRNRLFLPAQTHPVGRFNPVAQTFAAVGNLIDWNSIAPRAGLILDVSGHGRTVVKANYGRYWLSPGPELGFDANPNANQWWRRHTWVDTNRSGVWEQGEEGRLLGSRGGLAVESLDPGLEPALLDEVTASVERELRQLLGVRTGIVWRSERQHWMRRNTNQPTEAFTIPVAIADPGPDGKIGTGDDGPLLAGYDLAPEFLSRPPVNIVRNVPGADSSHWTWETTATRRFADGWSLAAGFDYTWSRDQASGYSGQAVRNNTYPLTPNDLINAGTSGGYEFGTWSAKVSGTYDAPWHVRVSPLLRHQSGQPYGRTFSTGLKYGTVRILAEPIGTRRMDNVTIFDVRVEKGFALAGNRRVAAIVDVFNLLNANPEQNVSWSSGSFLRPLAIVAPRIVRLGGKLEW